MTRMMIDRIRGTLAVLALLGALLLSACGGPTGSATSATLPTVSPDDLAAVLAASELTVGQNRLPLGVVQGGTPTNDANIKVRVRFFKLDTNDQAQPADAQGETEAVYRGQGLPFGLYVAYPTFAQPGPWGIDVQMTPSGKATQSSRLRVEVLEKPSTPAVGSQAVPSNNLTAKDVPDLKQLTSDRANIDPALYQMTVANALAAKKPFLVAFSTPGFCETAVCAPNLNVIKQLRPQFAEQVNFIHVEVYPYPFSDAVKQRQFVPAMAEWSLQSEPWTFLVDGSGVIQAKYEGGITFAELEPALGQLAAGQPVTPLQ